MVVPSTEGTYTYIQLLNALQSVADKKVNVWASVAEATKPRTSRGTDLVQNVYILDPSLAVEEGQELSPEQERLRDGVEVLIFSSDEELFPQASPGDIIRFHRVQLNEFNGKPQLLAKIGKGSACHYCLFDKKMGGPMEPLQRSSAGYTMTQADRQSLEMLREFYTHHGSGQMGPSKYLSTIHDLEPNSYVDIICRVVAVEDRGTRQEVFYVWDGTDSKPYHISVDRRKEIAEASSPAENNAGQMDDAMLCRRLPPFTGGREGDAAVPDFPEYGSTFPVNLYKPIEKQMVSPRFPKLQLPHKSLSELPALGSWVKLKNVCVVVVEGQLQALYNRSSKWTAWKEMPASIREKYEQRDENNGWPEWGPTDSGEVVAWPEDQDLDDTGEVTSLRQILMTAGSRERKRFKCFVRIVDYLPQDPAKFCRNHRGRWQFCIRMHLEDATAELDATLVGENGTRFFRGCPQMDLSTLPDFRAALERTMLACTSLNSREGGEWMGCCIERIYPEPCNSQDTVDARYRLVNTILESRVDCI